MIFGWKEQKKYENDEDNAKSFGPRLFSVSGRI